MILIVDDEMNIRVTLQEYLHEEGYDCLIAANSQEALKILGQKDIRVVICDLKMPGMNGLELLKMYKKQNPESFTQFIMVTGFTDINSMRLGFQEGAIDYLYKPVTLEEVKAAVAKGMEKYMFKFAMQQAWDKDRQKLVEAKNLIAKKHLSMIELMLKMVQQKDKFTEEHCKRVCEITNIIAQKMNLGIQLIAKIKLAALLHDVGKIAISNDILLKPGKLSAEEYAEIKKHPQNSFEIVKDYVGADIAKIILHHHENFDGTGYPHRLAGSNIPLGSRIIAIADEYDALRNKRPYRRALSREEALKVIKEDAKKFDPAIFKIFISQIETIEERLFPSAIKEGIC